MEINIGEIVINKEMKIEDLKIDYLQDKPLLIDLEVTPKSEEQIFNHDGYYGYDIVKVNKVKPTKYKPRYVTFALCELKEIQNELEMLDTSDWINLRTTFMNSSELESIDLTVLDLDKIVEMDRTFYGCRKLKQLDIRNLELSKVVSHPNAFFQIKDDTLIIVKDENNKSILQSWYNNLTNIKTASEIIENSEKGV